MRSFPGSLMIDEEVNKKISQLLNNGFAFGEHKTKRERDEIEEELVEKEAKKFPEE